MWYNKHMSVEAYELVERTPLQMERAIDNTLVAEIKSAQAEIAAATDPAEVAAATARSSDAWTGLYTRHYDGINRSIMRKVGQAETAEDIAQSTFLHAVKGLKTYDETDPAGNFAAWLFRIGHNETMNHFRSVKTRIAAFAIDSCEETLGHSLDIRSHEDTPEQEVSEADALEVLVKMFPEPQRRTLIMTYIEGLDKSTIATKLGVAEATVGTQNFRGRNKLRVTLREYAVANPDDPTSDTINYYLRHADEKIAS